jgi:hypothetical protein
VEQFAPIQVLEQALQSHTLIKYYQIVVDTMRTVFANAFIVLVWLYMTNSNIDQYKYHLNAWTFLGIPFIPKRGRDCQWQRNRGGIGSIIVSSSTATSTPRKYRHLDVQEEYARERSGAQKPYLPGNWFDRISQRLTPQLHQKDDAEAAQDASRSAMQQIRRLKGDATIRQPCSDLIRGKNHQHVVTNVHELRHKILDEGWALQSVKVECPYTSVNASIADILQHDVIQVMVSRYHSQSKPGQRHKNDTAYLALAIEGGGVRGAVCSGMAAAIATLGLTDSFDTIVGSSAGSVIGAYMVRYVYGFCFFLECVELSMPNPLTFAIICFRSLLCNKVGRCVLMFT